MDLIKKFQYQTILIYPNFESHHSNEHKMLKNKNFLELIRVVMSDLS